MNVYIYIYIYILYIYIYNITVNTSVKVYCQAKYKAKMCSKNIMWQDKLNKQYKNIYRHIFFIPLQ